MADVGTAAAAMPEWVYLIGGLIGAAAATYIARRGSADGKQERADANRVGAIAAIQPTADRFTQDALVQTLAKLDNTLNRWIDKMDEDDRDERAEEKAELRELRRLHRETAGEHPIRRDQR